MSSEPLVLRAEGIGKRYRIGQHEPYKALRDVLTDLFAAPVRVARRRTDSPAGHVGPANELWALEDVSFEVRRGEVVGLIGANGAGKSTLLKILSRITEPTSGQVVVHGRVGSLLEVGTGFHPELTGRENIFLNGTILGMRKGEIARSFDEIVEFAGMAQFLDTPVKRYSSGMIVRLAFAVAAHLQPEILLVDEVLAVGDAEFQRKCLGKMEDVTRQGRTILFVSHNLSAVRALCPRSLVLDHGRLAFDGPTDDAIHRYLRTGGRTGAGSVEGAELEARLTQERLYADRPFFRALRVAALDEHGVARRDFRSDEEITIAVDYECLRAVPHFRVLVTLAAGEGQPLLRTETLDEPGSSDALEPGRYRSEVTLPAGLFGEVDLDVTVSLIAEVNQTLDYASVLPLSVSFEGHHGNMRGNAALRPSLRWRTELLEASLPTSS